MSWSFVNGGDRASWYIVRDGVDDIGTHGKSSSALSNGNGHWHFRRILFNHYGVAGLKFR